MTRSRGAQARTRGPIHTAPEGEARGPLDNASHVAEECPAVSIADTVVFKHEEGELMPAIVRQVYSDGVVDLVILHEPRHGRSISSPALSCCSFRGRVVHESRTDRGPCWIARGA